MSTTWEDKVKAAHELIHALCQPRGCEGSRQWIMSIPAREDYDPDLVITSGLMAAEKEIAALAAEVDSRDEVITKLLEILRFARGSYFGSITAHERACEIAGRAE